MKRTVRIERDNLTAILGNSLAQCDNDHGGPTVMQHPERDYHGRKEVIRRESALLYQRKPA